LRVCVTGPDGSAAEVQGALRRFGYDVVSPAPAQEEPADAAVWLAPLVTRYRWPAVEAASATPAAVVRCALMPDEVPDAVARRAYAAGFDAVYVDPRERTALCRDLPELVSSATNSLHAQRVPDPSFSRAAWLRLQAGIVPVHPSLEVIGDAGRITLQGRVGSWTEKRALEAAVAHVPGVRAVRDGGVQVAPSRDEASAVAQAVRHVLDADPEVRDTLIAAGVRRSVATLTGAAATRDEARRAYELAKRVDGADRIRPRLWISDAPAEMDADHNLAQGVRRLLAARHAQAEVTASVVAGRILLAGVVRSTAEAQRIAETVGGAFTPRAVEARLDLAAAE